MHPRFRLTLTFALLGCTVSCATINLDTLKRASWSSEGSSPKAAAIPWRRGIPTPIPPTTAPMPTSSN